MSSYSSAPPHEQTLSPIPYAKLAIVLADFGTGCHSPALLGRLSTATDPATLADMSNGWIAALIDPGADPKRVTAFVQREEVRVRASPSATGHGGAA